MKKQLNKSTAVMKWAARIDLVSPCQICPKVYLSRRSMQRHERKAHQVDYRTSWMLILWKKLTWRLK